MQAEDGIRDLVRSRGLGDVYKRQTVDDADVGQHGIEPDQNIGKRPDDEGLPGTIRLSVCLLYTSDAADERSSVDLGGRRIIKKKKKRNIKRVSRRTK